MELEALKEILKTHRAWLRNERGGRRADLSLKVLRNLNLRNLQLPKSKLTGIQLINCDLSGANLRESDLFAANLAGSRFIGADCRECDFRGAHLPGADFSEAQLSGCDFREGSLMVNTGGSIAPPKRESWHSEKSDTAMNRADLTGAKMRNSIIRKADLSGAVLRNADLSGANLDGSSLKDADLRGANLANCDLSGSQMNRADLTGAFMDGATLNDANVYGVDLSRAVYNHLDTSTTIAVDDSAETQALIGEMVIAHEIWVNTTGAEGQRADFSNADLSGINLSGKNLRGALFADSKLRSAKFHRTILDLADFSRADLTGANLEDAILRGANFTGANLRRANFRKSDLKIEISQLGNGQTREWPPRFVACILDETNFSDALSDRLIARDISLKKVIAGEAFMTLLKAELENAENAA